MSFDPPIPTLVVLEHDGQRVRPPALRALALARQLGAPYALAVLGSGIAPLAEPLRAFGAALVWLADDPALAEPLADRYAAVIVAMAKSLGAATVLGTASTLAKDVLPRVAALLDAPMLTEVTAMEIVDGAPHFQRMLGAGRWCATVQLDDGPRVLTVRPSAFHPPEPDGNQCPVERYPVDAALLPAGMRFVSRERLTSGRPDLSEARVVVSGGRPLRDRDTFERLIGGLADALAGAVGATRAAVDAGMAGNECQVGQTAKTVAPELYIAAGISGAIQHIAGIMDSKVIVAINRDPDAPIFQVATYGLVGDLHEVLPRLIQAVRA